VPSENDDVLPRAVARRSPQESRELESVRELPPRERLGMEGEADEVGSLLGSEIAEARRPRTVIGRISPGRRTRQV